MNDNVFGEVTYKHGWKKPMEINLFGQAFSIMCSALAYTGQEIVEAQRTAYKHFISNQEKFLKQAETGLKAYCASLGIADYAATQVQPKTLVFNREGECAILLDCNWDVEHGLVICLFPEPKIGPQDIFL